MKVISIVSRKGGVGKSTIAVHLAHYLSGIKKKQVLLIDCDAQANASEYLVEIDKTIESASRLYTDATPSADTIEEVDESLPGLFLIHADDGLDNNAKVDAATAKLFRSNVRELGKAFDYVVIDTPPDLGSALGAIIAADAIVTPIEATPSATSSLKDVREQIESARHRFKVNVQYLGVLFNKYDKRNPKQVEAASSYIRENPDFVMPDTIGNRASIADIQWDGIPVWKRRKTAARIAAKEMRAALEWIVAATEKL